MAFFLGIHFGSLFASPSFGKWFKITQRLIYSELVWRMGVHLHLVDRCLIQRFGAPSMRRAQEERLLARKRIQAGQFLFSFAA